MDALSGKNSTGRRVSLLNDGPTPLARLPSITPSLQSRTSSYTSSPINSPPTPRLVRSDSADSTMQTPSPITPDDFTFELSAQSLESPGFAPVAFLSPPKEVRPLYPPVPHPSGALPYHFHAQPAYFRPVQEMEDPTAPATAASSARPKKNSYPCPMAKQFRCNDYFTTSGHAARHAKKHTGKKDAFCPECNKAFTRKDNMEQHRRTHSNGRGSAKGSERDAKKAKHQAKRPRVNPLQPSLSSLAMVDPTLPHSPAEQFSGPANPPTDSFPDFAQRSPYPDPTSYAMTHAYNATTSYGGLDALAIAASGEKRKFES